MGGPATQTTSCNGELMPVQEQRCDLQKTVGQVDSGREKGAQRFPFKPRVGQNACNSTI